MKFTERYLSGWDLEWLEWEDAEVDYPFDFLGVVRLDDQPMPLPKVILHVKGVGQTVSMHEVARSTICQRIIAVEGRTQGNKLVRVLMIWREDHDEEAL